MIEVIEHGYNKYKAECYTCNCKFTYELSDLTGSSVICPDCGHYVQHYPDDHTRDSQIKEK